MSGKNDAEDSSPSNTNEAQNESLSNQSVEEEPAELVSISATYSGSTEAGVSIETGVEGIGVRGTMMMGAQLRFLAGPSTILGHSLQNNVNLYHLMSGHDLYA